MSEAVTQQSIQGGCLCGTVRYEVQLPYLWSAHCHCSMCRKHHGTLHGTAAAVAPEKFRWLQGEDAIVHYRSSAKFERPFCKQCGSTLPDTSTEHVLIPVGTLDDHAGVKPQVHIFAAHRSPLYEFDDGLQKFDEYPAGFGTSVPGPTHHTSDAPVSGSCLCGEVAYEIDAKPQRIVHCHCSRCRRSRGTAHGTNFFMRKDKFRWVRGATQVRTFKVPEAKMFVNSFCSNCGSLLPSLFEKAGAYLVPVGSVNSQFEPTTRTHIFTDDKVEWVVIPGNAPQYTQMPPQDRFGEVF